MLHWRSCTATFAFLQCGRHFGNGQLSLIFGALNFCTFSLLVLCLFKLQVGAKRHKNLGHQKLGTVGRFRSFVPKAALQQTKNCTATSKSLRCRKVAAFLPLSCGFQAPTFRHPRFGLAEGFRLRIWKSFKNPCP